jgi:Rieske Fe-S protein
MKRGDLIQKVLSGLIVMVLVSAALSSCNKDEPEKQKSTLTIDLTDPDYAALANLDGFVVLDTLGGLIVVHTREQAQPYIAAMSKCTYCGSSISFLTDYSKEDTWKCNSCQSIFGWVGNVLQGPATNSLGVYGAVKLGNKLVITLDPLY